MGSVADPSGLSRALHRCQRADLALRRRMARVTRLLAAALCAIACAATSCHGATATSDTDRRQSTTSPTSSIRRASESSIDGSRRCIAPAATCVVVATVPTFQPYADIREYAVKMFENGGKGIGEKGKDNGLLIVVAVEDRKVGIEVGYGLEGFVTDGFAGQTIREAILPLFRQGQYGKGFVAGTTRVINRIAEGRKACSCRMCLARCSPNAQARARETSPRR